MRPLLADILHEHNYFTPVDRLCDNDTIGLYRGEDQHRIGQRSRCHSSTCVDPKVISPSKNANVANFTYCPSQQTHRIASDTLPAIPIVSPTSTTSTIHCAQPSSQSISLDQRCDADVLSQNRVNSQIKGNESDLYDLHDYHGSYTTVCIQNTVRKSFHVPGDGNCFFSSLSLAKHGDFSRGPQYRQLICNHILQNWDIWADSITLAHDTGADTPALYSQHMLNSNGWATSTEIQAACALLHTNITVWLRGIIFNEQESRYNITYTQQPYSTANTKGTIHLLLSASHFTVLCDVQDPSVICQELSKKRNCMHFQINTAATSSKKVKSAHSATNQTLSVSDKDISADSKSVQNIPNVTSLNIKRNHHTCSAYTDTYANELPTNNDTSEKDTYHIDKCRKLGIPFITCNSNDTLKEKKNTTQINRRHVKQAEKKLGVNVDNLPSAPSVQNDSQFNKAMDCIRTFELQQMSYTFNHCQTCHERRLQMKMANATLCRRCYTDKNRVKMFSSENLMNPQHLPDVLSDLTVVEQQLISRLAPVINIHLLKHGGIAANGHCVAFPQNVNEPAQILPKLPEEIKVIRVRKKGSNDTSKEFNVRRSKIENALIWLKANNPAYADIIISQVRLSQLPENDAISIDTIETKYSKGSHDDGPAVQQVDPGETDGHTYSGIAIPDSCNNIKDQVEQVVHEVVGPNHEKVTQGRKYVCIPWPTQDENPLSEFTTSYFFTLSFPCLFPYGQGDFHINRPRTCTSMSDWAEHLMWYEDGRFAQHPYFKFIVHNIIMRKRTLEQSTYIVRQQLGDNPITVSELKQMMEQGDTSIAQKVLYFGASLRGTSQYWAQRNKELRALVQYQINEGKGLPSFFTTGSCAEYHFKPLKRLLEQYTQQTSGQAVDLCNRNTLFTVLQKNTHIVSQYFDLRTVSYFENVMSKLFGVDTYWYRQEFAKSRGMVHWHGLCWRSDREPHNLLYEAIQRGLSEDQCAEELSAWAASQFAMTALHPAGKDSTGNPRKDLWPPPEGTAPAPPEDANPLLKLLMDVSETQASLLEDHLLLSNRINIHRCSSYCLRSKNGVKRCRMEFGTENNPGKSIRNSPAIVKDKNGSMRLEMARDHPMLVQHSKFHTQGWRANGDISLILSKNPPDNPSVNEIISTEKYITGYACKGNDSTGAVNDLFQDIAHAADETTSTKSVCTKLLMNTVKRDISSTEASYELLSLPLYRCSREFQSVSFTGSRVLERKGHTLTKSTPLDRYLSRPQDQQCSWYQYICNQGKVPVISGCSMRATWPLTEDFCRSMLLLHWPAWRNLSDIKSNESSWSDLFQEFVTTDACPTFVKADIERAKRNESVDVPNGDNESETSDNEDGEPPSWMDILQPDQNFQLETDLQFDDGGPDQDWGQLSRHYPNGLGLNWLQEIDKDVPQGTSDINSGTLAKLNDEQRFAFNLVLSTLIESESEASSADPLRLIVSGTAGSGKSFLIKCLVHAIRILFTSSKAVQVLCPTGNSANLIAGRTIHDFLKIPTGHKSSKEMSTPDGTVGDSIQQNCSDLKVLIVDERSLVGATTLGWMEFHCRFGMKTPGKSWGGIPAVIFLGDDVQLPPVCDMPVYSAKCATSPAAMHGVLVWKEFTHVVELQTIVRQNTEQQRLKSVLLSLRESRADHTDALWLQQFQWDNVKQSYGDSLLQDMTDNGLFVFPTHDAESLHNNKQLLKANSKAPVATLYAVNSGSHAKTAQSDKSSGLLHKLNLCVGAKVMLTSNLVVPFGLFNGSIGVVRDIVYLDGRKPHQSLPDVIMVSFSKYNGPPFVSDDPTVVPIVPVERRIECLCHGCKRKQIPLRLGWGTTIHRCQGMTIGKGEPNRYIVIHPGSNKFESQTPGALFVALSRAKTAGGKDEPPDFAWNEHVLINEDRICHKVDTPTTRARNIEIKRLQQLGLQTKQVFHHMNNKTSFTVLIDYIANIITVEE